MNRPTLARRFELSYPETRLSRRGPAGIPPERELPFMQVIIDFARSIGWLVYHTRDSQKSAPGYPDVVMLRGSRQVVAEFKSGHGAVASAQVIWLTAYRDAGAETYVWRPQDKEEIVRILTRRSA